MVGYAEADSTTWVCTRSPECNGVITHISEAAKKQAENNRYKELSKMIVRRKPRKKKKK